jgi:hypothetical protein
MRGFGTALRAATAAVVLAAASAAPAVAQDPPALAKARALYNAGDYDGAITSAGIARNQRDSGDAAALVTARAYLERFRLRADPADLANARVALTGIRATALSARDQLDLLIGLGQSLYLADQFGPAAEIFDVALARVTPPPAVAPGGGERPGTVSAASAAALSHRDRLMLLDWWATALDREAQRRPADRRAPLYERIEMRMEAEVRADPGNAAANYWLAAAVRGLGDLDRAFDVAVAAWIRSGLGPETADTLRADLDRLVTQALVPERARQRPPRDLQSEWDAMKGQWK